jgi:hypothetical protein
MGVGDGVGVGVGVDVGVGGSGVAVGSADEHAATITNNATMAGAISERRRCFIRESLQPRRTRKATALEVSWCHSSDT